MKIYKNFRQCFTSINKEIIEFIDCSKLIISIKINSYSLCLSPNERLILFLRELQNKDNEGGKLNY